MTLLSGESIVPLRFVIDRVSDGSANFDLRSEAVEGFHRWEVSHASCQDATTEHDKILLLVGGKGEEYTVAIQLDPAAADWYWWSNTIYLYPGEYLIARFVGTTTGDALSLVFSGKEYRDLDQG